MVMDKCIMGEKCSESSVPTSSSAANWWPDVHANSLPSWGGCAFSNNPQNPNSNCSGGEEDVSISTSFTTNASNHSGLSNESSRQLVENMPTNEAQGETVSDNHHLWNQVLLSVGTHGELQNISNGVFEPAYDYLKKTDSGWDFLSPTNLNSFQKSFNGLDDSLYQNRNLSSVRSWSFAPLEVEMSHEFNQLSGNSTAVKNEHIESDIGGHGLFERGLSSPGIVYPLDINEVVDGNNSKYCYNGMPYLECGNQRGFGDAVKLGTSLSKPVIDINVSTEPMLKTLNLSDRRKPDFQSCYQITKNNGRGNGVTMEGKRKKTEENSAALKKSKHESSTVSSAKVQVPKAKLGDKITALQQIVSPFGKTDTASVLWEAIGYIKCLQEQVQLLSNPYLKTNIIKDPWGGLDRKERGDVKLDLQSRGLCLVPTSCTPQLYHDNSGADYWTPTYRGCFYR